MSVIYHIDSLLEVYSIKLLETFNVIPIGQFSNRASYIIIHRPLLNIGASIVFHFNLLHF